MGATRALRDRGDGLPELGPLTRAPRRGPPHRRDRCARFRFGETLINLLRASEAPSLVAPATVAPREAGVRHEFTLGVEDVDQVSDELKSRGVELLNGPMDRPWGIRTASFRDPGGHIWEIDK
jgi:uncharacterized glyoxalase superfamily protein PhnB